MVKALGADHIVKIWRQQKVRGKGASLNRAKTLVDAAHDSVGNQADRVQSWRFRCCWKIIR